MDTKAADLTNNSSLDNQSTKKFGDAIEKSGDGLKRAGFAKLGDVVHQAGDKVEHLDTGALKKQASDWVSGVTGRAQQFQDQVSSIVRERPIAILLGAVTLGLVAGKVMSSTASSSKKEAA